MSVCMFGCMSVCHSPSLSLPSFPPPSSLLPLFLLFPPLLILLVVFFFHSHFFSVPLLSIFYSIRLSPHSFSDCLSFGFLSHTWQQDNFTICEEKVLFVASSVCCLQGQCRAAVLWSGGHWCTGISQQLQPPVPDSQPDEGTEQGEPYRENIDDIDDYDLRIL